MTARSVKEWVGRTPDTPIPPRVKLRIAAKHGFNCTKCTTIHIGDTLVCDHIIALINGGENRESNLQPLCFWCHAIKTKADIAIKSKTYKKRLKHHGLHKSKHPLPYGRKSQWKKKLTGETVKR